MTQAVINNGTFDNDPSAESVRSAFGKVNSNFTELYARALGFLSLSIASANVIVPISQSEANQWIDFTGGLVTRTATFNPFEGFVWITNSGSASLNVVVGSTTITLAAGGAGYFHGDGTTNGLVDILPDIVGTGDVVGPGSATDGDVAIFDGTSGKLLKDTGIPGTVVARIDTQTQWSGKQVNGATPVTLTDGASVAWNMSLGNTFVWTLTGDHTLANPSNAVSGATGVLYINLAGHTATYGANIKLVGTVDATGEVICGYYVRGSNVTIVVGGLTGF